MTEVRTVCTDIHTCLSSKIPCDYNCTNNILFAGIPTIPPYATNLVYTARITVRCLAHYSTYLPLRNLSRHCDTRSSYRAASPAFLLWSVLSWLVNRFMWKRKHWKNGSASMIFPYHGRLTGITHYVPTMIGIHVLRFDKKSKLNTAIFHEITS